MKDLRQADGGTRRDISKSVDEIAQKDLKRILPELLPLLSDPDAEVRYYTAVALAASAYVSEANAEALHQAVPRLVSLLTDEDARVRQAAADAIALVMPHPPNSATPALVNLLKDKHAEVRAAALGALGRMDKIPPDAVSAVVLTLKQDTDPDVRGKAADVLGALRIADATAISALIDALGDREEFVRSQAVRALGSIGAPASSAVPRIKQIAADSKESPTLRSYAAYALRSIDQ